MPSSALTVTSLLRRPRWASATPAVSERKTGAAATPTDEVVSIPEPTDQLQLIEKPAAQQRAVAGFPEDPAHFVGVRAYQPGDSPRRIHWRATARTGTPRSKRFEASRERELLLAVDVQTMPGPAVGAGFDAERVEALRSELGGIELLL